MLAVLTALVALSTVVVGPVTTALATPGNPLRCDMLYSVNNSGNANMIDPATGGVTKSFPTKGSNPNQLGIAAGGAYAIYTAGSTIYKYDPVTEKTSETNNPGSRSTHGAINPANGIFYYGGINKGTLTVRAWDPAGTAAPEVLKIGVPGSPGGNGDLAFDAAGNMFFVAAGDKDLKDGSKDEGAIYSVNGPMPTAGPAKSVTATRITDVTSAFAKANSIAFGPGGYLYVGSSNFLKKVDPSNGKDMNAGLTSSEMTDMGSCNNPVSIELHKNLPDGRFAATDQFGLEIVGEGLTAGNTATTTGTASGVQADAAGPVLGLDGNTYKITETAAGTTSFENYDTTWACVDTSRNNAPVAKGEGQDGQFTVPANSGGMSVSCEFRNSAKKASLEILKTASDLDPAEFKVGKVIDYNFKVTNTGVVPLTNVTVDEVDFTGTGQLSAIECADYGPSLAPGASFDCTAKYTLTQEDVDNKKVENTATATGQPPGETPPVTSPPSKVVTPGNPGSGIAIVKTVTDFDQADFKVGGVVNYNFKITNTGDVTLTNVHPEETKFTGEGKISAIDCAAGASSLAPGASVDCTATYTLTQKDVDAQKVENTAVAKGTPPGADKPITSEPSDAVVTGSGASGIAIVKTVTDFTEADFKVGGVVNYNFKITNTGDVTLTNVTPVETSFSGLGNISDLVCEAGIASLAPGESVECTATYTLTQKDVDKGSVKNVAVAEGTPPGTDEPITSEPDEVIVEGSGASGIKIVKTATDFDPAEFQVGKVVDYTFKIINTGDVTLTDVKPVETDFSGSGDMSDFACEAGVTSLAPGESVECTATYTLTQKDVDAQKVTNIAVAEGTPPGTDEPITSEPDDAIVTGDSNADLSLSKTAEPNTDVRVGDEVTYSFTMTNNGELTLIDVTPTEVSFTGSGTVSAIECPEEASSLAPGDSVTCTATYVVTADDAKAGKVDNTAIASATTTEGDPVESNEDSATVTVKEDEGTGSLGGGSLGSLGLGSLGSLGIGSLGSLGLGSLGLGSLGLGSLGLGSMGLGSLGSSDGGSSNGGSSDGGSLGSQGPDTPGTPDVPGTPGTPETPGTPGTPETPGAPGDNGGSGQQGGLIDSGLGADSGNGGNTGLIAGGIALLIAAGGVAFVAIRRRMGSQS